MNVLLASSLLCAALGLALGQTSSRSVLMAAGLMTVSALAASLPSLPQTWMSGLLVAAFASVIITAACAYLPRGPGGPLRMALSANAGLWVGALAGAVDKPHIVALALPWALIALPTSWLIRHRARIAVQVVASWLVAVALLAGTLPLVSVPGYQSDHRE